MKFTGNAPADINYPLLTAFLGTLYTVIIDLYLGYIVYTVWILIAFIWRLYDTFSSVMFLMSLKQ